MANSIFLGRLNAEQRKSKEETSVHGQMSKGEENVQENVTDNVKMSLTEGKNVTDSGQMSLTEAENVPELTPEELDLSLEPKVMKSVKEKKKRRKQAIVGLMDKDSRISIETIAEKLDVHKRTILRDIDELKKDLVIERIGGDFGGEWKILKNRK